MISKLFSLKVSQVDILKFRKQKVLARKGSMQAHKVRLVLLVHGTFAGDDALGLFELLEPINKKLANKLKNKGKRLTNTLVNDVGNYTPEYADALSHALADEIACELFIWSSGNFHLARLEGTIKLAQTLAEKITQHNILNDERILLLGHSHAGQLFALLTHFLANDAQAQGLYDIMEKDEELKAAKSKLVEQLEIIKKVNLDIVTFGTPIRYSWGKYEKFRLMAIVNHRSNVGVSGLLSTRDGDYVQQWGIEGTDILPPEKITLNDELDAVLDKGRDVSLLLDSLKRETRRHPHYVDGTIVSETFLINYRDNVVFSIYLLNPFGIPHCIKTLFGHGVYTRNSTMLFNMKFIIDNWYSRNVK
jgi:hypothetical protein